MGYDAQIGREHGASVRTHKIDKGALSYTGRVKKSARMESAEAVAAKRRVLVDALTMCLERAKVMEVVDGRDHPLDP